ncbi:MAG: hypothetical protein EXR99_09615 [Gemmataceae bacterium]|nr:hypothetical protein [Gemmataceae bacterium]
MKKKLAILALASMIPWTFTGPAWARGPGGGHAAGFAGAAHNSGAHPSEGTRTTGGAGPYGGSWKAGTTSGSSTTKGGSTVNYGGAAAGGKTAAGGEGGRYVGGVQVTTPSGQTYTHAGTGGAARGPEGNTVAGREGVTATTGPYGSGATASRSAVTSNGTYYHGQAALNNQGLYVRNNFNNYNCFHSGWYGGYPGAWNGAGWAAAYAWTYPTYAALAAFTAAPRAPVYYDYGSTVVYNNGGVYTDGEQTGTTQESTQQASDLASQGSKTEPSKEEKWMPLGVFALVQGEEKTSFNIFQLAVNKEGVMRGNYYNAVTDANETVKGAVDKKTNLAAWTIGDKKFPVYQAGIANLTKPETTIMVHFSKDKTQQFSLIRIEQPEKEVKAPGND